MIIGDSKKEVVANIKKFAESGELNHKVETTDPVFTPEQAKAAIEQFYKYRKNKVTFKAKQKIAYATVDKVAASINDTIEVEGTETLKKIKDGEGVIITCNHFNPLDSLAVRKMTLAWRKQNPCIVSQVTNLALPDNLGFLMNHLNILPLSTSAHYIANEFKPKLGELLKNGELVLIYPEEEMWFNYRKPRTCRRGSYQFAAEFNAPILSCFTEIRELEDENGEPIPEPDNTEFYQVKYICHVLEVLRPNPKKSVRENSIELAQRDYELRTKAYEKIYGKKLDYKFSNDDVAGWRG